MWGGLAFLVLLGALYVFDRGQDLRVYNGAIWAGSISAFLLVWSRQYRDNALRAYAFISFVLPLLLLFQFLPDELTFTWIGLGYGVPLVTLGFIRLSRRG